MSVWACELDPPNEPVVVSDDTVTVQRSANLAEVWTRENYVPTNALSPDVYRIRRLEQGDAKLTSETVGKYLPQDLNYDGNGRVDFKVLPVRKSLRDCIFAVSKAPAAFTESCLA